MVALKDFTPDQKAIVLALLTVQPPTRTVRFDPEPAASWARLAHEEDHASRPAGSTTVKPKGKGGTDHG
jgi:hypothetical protein